MCSAAFSAVISLLNNFVIIMLDFIAKFFLSFSQEIIIIPAAVLGYIWFDRKIFFSAICLMLLSMLLNFDLKATFQIPLATGKGFAFPSGHMQSSTVFYGWLITKIQEPIFQTLSVVVLIGIGLSLVYFGYHNFFDLAGGIFCAVLLILFYNLISTQKERFRQIIIFSFSTILLFYAAIIYQVADHLWLAYYCLIGITLSENFFAEEVKVISLFNKALSTFFCLIIIFTIRKLFAVSEISSSPAFLNQIQWLIIGFSLPYSVFAADYFIKKTHNRL
jgi:undecaprenyl-diphosphatase